MAAFTIHSYPQNPRAFKGQIAARINGVEIALSELDLASGQHKTPEFLAKNPLGKVPVLETPEGPIFESNAIARYAARLNGDRHKLYGRTPYHTGLIDQWIDFAANEIDFPAAAWLYPIYGLFPENADATKAAKGDIRKALKLLDDHLLHHQFLVGDRFSLADIVVAMSLTPLYKLVLDAGFRKQFVNTNRWFELVRNQPDVLAVAGPPVLATKMAVAPKVEAPKEAAPAPKPKAAAAPKPAAAASSSSGPAEGEEGAEEKKPKGDIWAGYPETKFDMLAWKAQYSNKDFRKEALPWFWENFDPQGMSLWFADYKYNSELEVTFKVCNLIAGFNQRVEGKVLQGSFGNFLILGKEPKLAVHGAFLFRGQDIHPLFKENADFEAYTWTRADITDPEQKAWLQDLWGWESEDRKFVLPRALGGDGTPFDCTADDVNGNTLK